MAHCKTERNPLFSRRWFENDIILLCLRWYFRFKLSYRDLVVILGERGLSISHSTILRWVVRYAATCEKRWSRFERPVGGRCRVDETFIKVRGQWMCLYRAVDGQGNTVEFYLSRTRGIAAAKAFFRKALKHHREPHSITLDGHQPSHSALRRMGMNGEFNFRGRNMVTIRCCQYLNSVVAWIGAEMEFALSQAVASGDAFEHRPSECGHCVQDFLAELDLRDLPGEAAGFELGADDTLPTADLRFYPAALVVPCG